jgi:hypothetical protein
MLAFTASRFFAEKAGFANKAPEFRQLVGATAAAKEHQ